MQLRATRLTAIASAVKRAIKAFSPAQLFGTGAPGVWYDPSDYTTLFQDSAGTTPVTAVEQPVGLMLDKSKGLVLGPELVTNGDFSNGTTGWTPSGCIQQVVGNELELTAIVPGFISSDATITTVVGRTYKYTANIRRNQSSGTARITVVAVIDGSQVISLTPSSVSIIFKAVGTTTTIRLGAFNAILADKFSYSVASVKELPGNHAFQSTSASRPVLSARYNLLTKTEEFDDAAWTKNQITAVSTSATNDPLGGVTAEILTATASNNFHRIFQSASVFAANIGISAGVSLKKGTYRYATVISATDYSNGWIAATIDLDTGVITKTGVGAGAPTPSLTSATATSNGNGWFFVSLIGVPTQNTATRYLMVSLASSATPTYGASFADDSWAASGTESIYIWGADLRVSNNGTTQPTYQRVNTSTDYATTGFLPYLKFDGVDDSLSTNSISFTSTDKMSVFAGVRKLTTGIYPIIAELSASANSNNGSFGIFASSPINTTDRYGQILRGTAAVSSETTATHTVPTTDVLASQFDIAQSTANTESTLRVDGQLVAMNHNGTDAGTGKFGNYPLYIGRRGGTTFPFNGQLYSMIIVGKQVTATELSSTETYTAAKTGVTL